VCFNTSTLGQPLLLVLLQACKSSFDPVPLSPLNGSEDLAQSGGSVDSTTQAGRDMEAAHLVLEWIDVEMNYGRAGARTIVHRDEGHFTVDHEDEICFADPRRRLHSARHTNEAWVVERDIYGYWVVDLDGNGQFVDERNEGVDSRTVAAQVGCYNERPLCRQKTASDGLEGF
jgi:hypothetical protein